MSVSKYYLAQINIAELKAPLDDPLIKEFRESIDFVNETGRNSPGFVWLYTGEEGQASSYVAPLYENPLIVVNFTLWEDYDSFHNFVYHTVHSYFIRSRKKWMNSLGRPHLAMWWVPAGSIPTIEEAKAKLEQLEKEGPSADVFDLKNRYDANGQLVNGK